MYANDRVVVCVVKHDLILMIIIVTHLQWVRGDRQEFIRHTIVNKGGAVGNNDIFVSFKCKFHVWLADILIF